MSQFFYFIYLIQWLLVISIFVCYLYGAEEFALKLSYFSAFFMIGFLLGGV
jgi:hypothetical protein